MRRCLPDAASTGVLTLTPITSGRSLPGRCRKFVIFYSNLIDFFEAVNTFTTAPGSGGGPADSASSRYALRRLICPCLPRSGTPTSHRAAVQRNSQSPRPVLCCNNASWTFPSRGGRSRILGLLPVVSGRRAIQADGLRPARATRRSHWSGSEVDLNGPNVLDHHFSPPWIVAWLLLMPPAGGHIEHGHRVSKIYPFRCRSTKDTVHGRSQHFHFQTCKAGEASGIGRALTERRHSSAWLASPAFTTGLHSTSLFFRSDSRGPPAHAGSRASRLR